MLGRTNAQQQSRRNERDHLKFMRAKWYSRLHPAPVVAFITGAGTELEKGRGGGNKTAGDGIAFLFRGRRGGGSLSLRVTGLPPPFLPSDVPAGEMGRDHKNPRAGVSFCHRCL